MQINLSINTDAHRKLRKFTTAGLSPIQISAVADTGAQTCTDVALHIIEPIQTGTPTTWCSRMITVPKKDGTPRRTVDLQNLNSATKRETHHTQSPLTIVSVVPMNTKKTTLDAWNGDHSVLLADDAKDATTFITEWGRYRYLRAPQGFHGSNDGNTKRFDDITNDFPRVRRCVDDSLLWDDNTASAFWHTMKYIKLCGDNGIVFNPTKFEFAKDTIEFAGFDVTADGYKPNLKLLNAIKDFPSPRNITGIRSWFGLVNQASYAFAHAPTMSPFQELLKHEGKFYWDDTLERLFQKSKIEIIKSIKDGVQTFEVNRQTCITSDWSKNGLGFTLSQKHCSCAIIDPLCGEGHWKIAYAGSRFTSPAESRYAPIEGEALALLFALESCKIFVMGCPNLVVAVDHKPLTRIFNNRDLNEIKNPRLLKIREKTLMFQFRVIAIPGTSNKGADAMSRISPPQPDRHQSDLADIRENISKRRYTQAIRSKPDTPLEKLNEGDIVSIQNQDGNNPLRWEKTGMIAETLPHKQYRIVVDGSRRTTLRNRQFLRKIKPETRNTIIDLPSLTPAPQPTIPVTHEAHEGNVTRPTQITPREDNTIPSQNAQLDPKANEPRRSTRIRKAPSRFKDFIMTSA